MFSCVWLHFKKCFRKYFLMFGCVLENIIENTFFTCCSHFLTFSRLPNEYIISFIPQNTNKTYKKNHQIRTNGEIAIAIDADRRGPGDHAVVFGTLADHADQRGAGDHADRSLSLSRAKCVLFAWVFSFCGSLSLSLLRFFRKSFEGKTTM